MPISLVCRCGRRLRVPDSAAGKRARCPVCGATAVVPAAAEADGLADAEPSTPPTRTYWHVLLLLALAPLVVFTFTASAPRTFREQLHATMAAHPELTPKLHDLTLEAQQDHMGRREFLDALFDLLPGRRMQGALLPYGSEMHWLFGLASAAAFLDLAVLIFGRGQWTVRQLLAVGAFTGTIGIVFLLGVQWVALQSQHMWLRGTSIVVIIFYIVKFIGFSYAAALGDTGFVLSFLGFICGVGFCEEVCKLVPLAWWYTRHDLASWRAACIWGMVSGFGFGVSEAITYAGDYYNGRDGGGIYLVRFISCVALHGIWTASAGIMFYRQRHLFSAYLQWHDWLVRLLMVVWAPVLLHGLYDTLLKKDMSSWALVVALASFGYLAWLIETSHRRTPASDDLLSAAR